MKRKLLIQFLNVLTSALIAIGIVWLVPGARAALAQDTSPSGVSDSLVFAAPVLSYQGRLLNPATGVPKADGSYSMKFSLYTAEAGGAPLWSETKSVAVSKGLFSTLLGDAVPLTVANFNGQALWLGVTVGADPEAAPRQRVAHTAYAIHAETAASATTATTATNATNATNANNSTFFNNHAYNEFYKGNSVVQVTSTIGAGGTHNWFSFGYSADQLIVWRVKPTTVGGKLKLDIQSELGGDGTITYWLLVTNTGSITTDYQLIRHHFIQ